MKNGKFVLHHTKQRKGKSIYIYYMIAWYYRKNGKPYRDILKHLGKIDKSQVEYYRNSLACLNKEPNIFPCNLKNVSVRNSNEFLSCAVAIHFWEYWELSTVFKSTSSLRWVSTQDMAKILTVLRMVRPCSKSYTTELYRETCLPQLTGVSPSSYNKTRIFRELQNIEKFREDLGKHIFNAAKKKGLTKGKLLFYDLSSGNFTGLRCVLAKWGHSKDGYRTHVVLSLVITPEGYPIYWEVLEGNTADAKTIEDLISKMENIYGRIDSVVCFDRGMVSDDNLKLLEGKKIWFITALDGNQIKYFDEFIDFPLINKVKKLDLKKQESKIEELLTISGEFIFSHNNLFFKEINLTDNQKRRIEKTTKKLALKKRRYFLAFNPELAYLTDKHRKERVQDFKIWVEEYNTELSKALGDRKKEAVDKAIKRELRKQKIANVDIKYTLSKYKVENKNEAGKTKRATTYKISLTKISAKAYEAARKYDGLWVLLTNISRGDDDKFFEKTNFESYFEIYRLKNTIEESFRILSDFVEIEPFHVYKTEHIRAHFTTCVLSYLIDVTILNRIRASEKITNMGLHTIFNTLKKCKQDQIQISEETVISNITQLTDKQEKLLDILGCSYLVSPKYLSDNHIVSFGKDRA